MAKAGKYSAPRGTVDLVGDQAHTWEYLMRCASEVFSLYGYEPIYTPIFEQTELFVRGIGEATDVVGKEMYTFEDKSGRSLTLRPENTASVVRASISNALLGEGRSAKLFYAGPMFRYERPMKGRQRQFYQIGTEALGLDSPEIDAESIIMLMHFFEAAGIDKSSMRLLINSMGDEHCRPQFRNKVADFLRAHSDELCEECNKRADTNPLRAFDCKNPACAAVMEDAPKLADELCDSCAEHHAKLKHFLDEAGLSYREDPRLVRGLDYYTRTVFEVQVDAGLGAQNAIGGGGRYDGLAEALGGKPAPGIGFAVGFERISLVLEEQGFKVPKLNSPEIFIAIVSPEMGDLAFELATKLRKAGHAVLLGERDRSLKSQLKLADRAQVAKTIFCGPDEYAQGAVQIRDMETKEERLLLLEDLEAASWTIS